MKIAALEMVVIDSQARQVIDSGIVITNKIKTVNVTCLGGIMSKYYNDQRTIRLNIDNWRCQVCGKRATQSAHRAANTKTNKKLYGDKRINHNMNLVSVCDLDCNDKVMLGEGHAYSRNILMTLILNRGQQRIKTSDINEMIEVDWRDK